MLLLGNFWKIVEYEKRASNFKFHQDSDLRKGYKILLRCVKSSTLYKVFEKTGKIFDGASPKHRTALPLPLSGSVGVVSDTQFSIFLALMFALRSPRPVDSSSRMSPGSDLFFLSCCRLHVSKHLGKKLSTCRKTVSRRTL